MIQAVILAGGEGRRLKSVTGDIPKPLVPIAGRPLLDHQLTTLRENGVGDVLLLVGYGAAAIRDCIRSGERWGLSVRYREDGMPRGTAGAVMAALDQLDGEFLVVYGDTIFDIDLERMMRAHRSAVADATLLVHPNDHPFDSDLVEVDKSGKVVAFHPYPHTTARDLQNLINAGMYVLNRRLLQGLEGMPERPDFGRHVFPALLKKSAPVFGYRSPEYIKDAGTPDRRARIEKDILAGRVAGKSLRKPCPAVFLDRDGTINEEGNPLRQPEDLTLLPGAARAVAQLNQHVYRTVVVTNQAIVAKGECDEATLAAVHQRLDALLGQEAAYLDALYFCPHIPDIGFPGERRELKIDCDCRKPKIGMIKNAAVDLNIDLAHSWVVGDSTTDVLFAAQAGCRSILVRTGHAGLDGKFRCAPDFECSDLRAAVSLIVDHWPAASEAARPLATSIRPSSVVLVAGQAHSGKSTLAGALKLALRSRSMDAVVVPADSWLKDPGDREAGVLGRYDLQGLAAFVAEARRSPGSRSIGRYDRNSRTVIRDLTDLFIRDDTVIIVEGVPTLASTELRNMGDVRIFVERNESERKAAFQRDYEMRGWQPAAISRLYETRMSDEFPIIAASASDSQIVSL